MNVTQRRQSTVYHRKLTLAVREQFAGITKRAFAQFINERITERLRSAIESGLPTETKSDADHPENSESGATPSDSGKKIATTEEELQGYQIVKAIVCSVIDAERIVYRDTQSYFGILCDDSNRKPICRLHFNGKQKYVGIIEGKSEEKVPINSLNEIYKLADRLKTTAGSYVKHEIKA